MEKGKLIIQSLILMLLPTYLYLCSRAHAMSMNENDAENVVTRTYYHDFSVKSTACTRLCETKNILTVNEQFPGPTLHAHRLDTLVVNVHNQADHNISIHWHGVRQLRNPWADGASQITQCPIQPGRNYTYNITFTSEEGTLWWHAHSHLLRATVHGAVVVLPRRGTSYPFPGPHLEVPIILGEWWKMDVVDVYKQAAEKGEAPMHSDAYTINGQPGELYPCSIPADTFKIIVEQGRTYLLRVISAAMEQQLFFAVAGHRLTLVSADGSYTKPLVTDYIMISPGQTMDILVHAAQSPMRYAMSAGPFGSAMGSMRHHMGLDMGSMGPMPTSNVTTAIFQYIHNPSSPSSMSTMFPTLPLSNDSRSANNFTRRIKSLEIDGYERDIFTNVVDVHMFITLSMGTMHSGSMNNISFVDPKVDILKAYYERISNVYEEDFPNEPPRKFNYTGVGSTSDEDYWPPEFGTKVKVLDYGKNVEVVFQSTSIMSTESHPMHLHGHGFYVVGFGYGNFDPSMDPRKYNLVDPPRQSTVAVPSGGWATIRFKSNNPGVWLLHCHFEHHHYKGMSMVFVVKDGPNVFSRLDPPPQRLPAC